MPHADDVSHFMKQRRYRATRGTPEQLLSSHPPNEGFALPVEVIGIEIDVNVIDLGAARNPLDEPGKCRIELADGGIDVAHAA